MKELPKTYARKNLERRIYNSWCKNGYFTQRMTNQNNYSIVIPPPNITGQLHMGHALDNTLQDILIRYKRMAASIPCGCLAPITHPLPRAKIVETMKKEGLTKQDIGRDAFLERAWAWKEKYGGRIIEQLKIGLLLRLDKRALHHG